MIRIPVAGLVHLNSLDISILFILFYKPAPIQ